MVTRRGFFGMVLGALLAPKPTIDAGDVVWTSVSEMDIDTAVIYNDDEIIGVLRRSGQTFRINYPQEPLS